MRTRSLALLLAAAGLVSASLIAAAPANAATSHLLLSPTSAGTLPPATRSTYLAGDQVNGLTVKRASVTFTLPGVTCADSNIRGIFLGVGDELEVGNPTIVAGVEVACAGFETPYYALDSLVVGTEHFLTAGAAGDV